MEIQIFRNVEFGEVRTLTGANGEVLFCGADVAKALGYTNPQKAIRDHCKTDGVTNRSVIDSMGRQQETKFINEGNLYRLISHSKLKSAERFESWAFDEVLPTIRKHGAYMTEKTLEQALTNPDFLIQLATKLKEEQETRKALEAKIEQDKPKIVFAESVECANNSVLIRDLAKILKQNGVDIGQNRFFEILREKGYLIKYGESKNTPTQKSMDLGLFEVKIRTVNNPNGTVRSTYTTMVTGKGQVYFVNKFLKGELKNERI